MRFKFATVQDARTRYIEAGSGPALLLVHGSGMSTDSWLPIVPGLAKSFSVYAPDLLDNGLTERGRYAGGPPQPHMMDHLLAFADQLGLQRFSVVGSSLGCVLAILMYLQHPKRIDKLVLVGPGSLLAPPAQNDDAFKAAYANGKSAIENPSFESCKARMARVVFDIGKVPESLLVMQMLVNALPGAMESFERRMNGMNSPEARNKFAIHDKLAQIAAPTLTICGKQDPRDKDNQAAADAKKIPGSRVISYDRCGHWPHLEHPATFVNDVAAFVAS